ncbi:cyclin-c [Anaeramoeba ignava]|uniref:Cyclin-c n=1 Tax=Anaeramoeba ignava TaxID=1746090 RepID=A0A9Q0RH67_ANAIG|nr:cyclin-c [Anaeramoeba ignava]
MAANYWNSSHCNRWIFSKIKLEELLEKNYQFILPEHRKTIMFFFHKKIIQTGTIMKCPQKIISTCHVIFKRFYLIKKLTEHDPWLIFPTCFYLSSKIEEWFISANVLIEAISKITKWEYTSEDIFQNELLVLGILGYDLIVFHPYKMLTEIQEKGQFQELYQLAWSIINDSYFTDLCLLYSPYLLTLASLFIASITSSVDITSWFSQLQITNETLTEIKKVANIVLEFYKEQPLLNQHSEKIDALLEVVKFAQEAETKNGENPLHLVCYKNTNPDVIQEMLKYTDPNILNGETPLHVSCRNGNVISAHYLIEAKADTTIRNNELASDLIPSDSAHPELLQLLMKTKKK